MSARRLIGIDLAWKKCAKGKPSYSGCVELQRDGNLLSIARASVVHGIDAIVDWIEPDRGTWTVAVDAPLVVCNQEGRRKAEAKVSEAYRLYDAGALSTNLGSDKELRGVRLRERLEEQGGRLLECAGDAADGNLILETYPHPATVELFALNQIIKYKMKDGMNKEQRRNGQQELADRIRTHFCDRPNGLSLRRDKQRDKCLMALLCEPDLTITHDELQKREDKLDGLICAYIAAWADAGRCLQRFGAVGEGVMFIPCLRCCTGVPAPIA